MQRPFLLPRGVGLLLLGLTLVGLGAASAAVARSTAARAAAISASGGLAAMAALADSSNPRNRLKRFMHMANPRLAEGKSVALLCEPEAAIATARTERNRKSWISVTSSS